jgi:hypothetical protein
MLVPAADVCRRGAWHSAHVGADTCADACTGCDHHSQTHDDTCTDAGTDRCSHPRPCACDHDFYAGTDNGHCSTNAGTHVDFQL